MFASCANTKKTAYFNQQQDATLTNTSQIPQTFIQKNDILGITVSSANPVASQVYNAPQINYSNPTTNNSNNSSVTGYLVDAAGNIQFPVIGTFKVAGFTAEQLREKMVAEFVARKLLVDPIVSIRFLNFKVTVLGEVAHPTVVNVPNEKITILEALGLAGDLTIYGRRDNVMVIREDSTQKTLKRLNLNTSEIFTSPFYYLRPGDIVYVEPNKAKVANSGRGAVLLPVIFGGLSFAAIVVDRLTN
ncbi:MAG: polysaccharide export protein [Chitinophagaceae bacterium]|nr:MAG: polysaccharide export protein [Chitinophagaceae bacterium]